MLKALIAKGEGINLEFKSTIESAAKIAKTLAAFANTSGGTLLIGVQDNGNINGISSEQQEMEKIEEAADFLCEPPVTVSYEVKIHEGKRVLQIYIPESQDKPHAIRDAQGNRLTYVRVRDKSVPAGKRTEDLLSSVQKETSSSLLRYDNLKMLLTYLQKHGSISGKRFARLINISERRAVKILMELARQNILLLHDQSQALSFSLR